LNTSLVKRVTEKKLSNSDNSEFKQFDILFESSKQGQARQNTITLSGKGNIKVLLVV